MSRARSLLWLCGVNLYISAFTFGGGYVVIPMIREFFVEKKGLFGEGELMDMAAVAQSSPGAIAINLSALAGYRVAGPLGAFISCTAAVIPPIAILAIISLFYASFRDNALVSAVLKGMEAAVAAIILDLVIDMCMAIFRQRHPFTALLVPTVFLLNFLLKVNVALVLVLSVLATVLLYAVQKRREAPRADASGPVD